MTFRRKKNTIFRGFQRLMIIFASGGFIEENLQ